MRLIYIFWLLIAIGQAACSFENDPQSFSLSLPAHFPDSVPQPAHNVMTNAGIRLGKKLFYDSTLSSNGKVSCASCHMQEKAFSDGEALSTNGVSGNPMLRNAPALFNMAWHPAYFWDGGALNLESQVFGPLTHQDEMGSDLKSMLAKLQQNPLYPPLFEQSFGTDSIQSAFVARALAQFVRSVVSVNSAYDAHVSGKEKLDSLSLKGLAVFKEKQCVSCHPAPFFTDFSYHQIGLDTQYNKDFEGIYLGRFRISRDSADIGKFKTPSLRNVALTAPYMHDGRMASLDEVLTHYQKGVKQFATTDKRIMKGGNPAISFTESEKQALVAFLYSLTDSVLITETAYQKP